MSRLPPFITPRLHPSAIDNIDTDALQRHWTHPLVRRFLFDGRALGADAVADLVAGQKAQPESVGLWGVEWLHEPGLIGTIGLVRLGAEQPIELLVTLEPVHWGHGLATEAAHAMLRHAFDGLRLDVLHANTDMPNRRSVRLLLRLGFVQDAAASLLHFTLTRERWLALRDA
jgi:RimJ/RimL family protein N-acetyltransferase